MRVRRRVAPTQVGLFDAPRRASLAPSIFTCSGCSETVSRIAIVQGMLRPDLCFACYDQARRTR